jgi:hypothetical protein
MKLQRFFQILSLTTASLLFAQSINSYLGPNDRPSPGLVRVQVLVNDDPSPQGVQIISAQLDGQPIPLKPRDIYGFRGQASFQLSPAKYKLKWKVRRDAFIWPRTATHEEEVMINPRDLWLQITITGDHAAIT